MRVAIDIDSTLHHYWDLLSSVSVRRFGIDLPYEEQLNWGITRLRPEQLELCVTETHTDENILCGRPYAGAIDTVRRWHERGHEIVVASHRQPACGAATGRWLTALGLPYDDLYCGFDKVAHCVTTGVGVLIDDSPENLARAAAEGIVAATLLHPWNREFCEVEPVYCAADWSGLAAALAPVLDAGDRLVEPAA